MSKDFSTQREEEGPREDCLKEKLKKKQKTKERVEAYKDDPWVKVREWNF